MSARENALLRAELVKLQQALTRADTLTRNGEPGGRRARMLGQPYVSGIAHELETARKVAAELQARLEPKRPAKARLPKTGTVARAVLNTLELDQVVHAHDHLRMLAGLTDAELQTRIPLRDRSITTGTNSVRPRRVELVRRGLVEQVPDTSPDQPARWRPTALAYALLQQEQGRG